MKRFASTCVSIALFAFTTLALPFLTPFSVEYGTGGLGVEFLWRQTPPSVHAKHEVNIPAAPITLGSLGVPVTENFDILATTGTSSTIPEGWAFVETGTGANTTYAAGNGGSATGNTYSFGTSTLTERAFGGLLSGSVIPTIGASFTNDSGASINSLAISYTGEQWRLGGVGRGVDRIDFQYSTDATSLTTGIWNDIDALDFAGPNTTNSGSLDGNAAENRTVISNTINGLNIPSGATFWIRWTDFNITNSDDGLAVDDFSLTPNGDLTAPEIAVDTNTLLYGNQNVGMESAALTVMISNTGTADLNIGTLAKTGANAADFTITTDPSGGVITPANSATLQVTFTPSAPGSRTAQISIPSNDADEPETVISLSGNGVEPGQFQFSSAAYSIDESGGSATITVDRVGGDDGAVSVQYQTGFSSTIRNKKDDYAPKGVVATASGGSACGFGTNVDYINASGTFNFADGQTSKTFTVSICDDDLYEPTEGVPLLLMNPSGGSSLGTTSTAFLNISDNDIQPSVQFSTAASSVGEGSGTKTFTVNRTGASENTFTVDFATADGTALAGTCGVSGDYQANNGSLSFAAGDPFKTFLVNICDDAEADPTEIFSATLSNATDGAAIGTTNSETVTIVDNDGARTLVVDTLDDNIALNACTAALGDCSLRGANSAAQDGEVIAFDSGVFSLPQTIVLSGTEILIDNAITINGPGADQLTIDGGPGANRVFSVDGSTVTIRGMTITGGNGNGGNVGGAMLVQGGSVTLDAIHFHTNTTSVCGGAVWLDEFGTHVLKNSTVSGNSSTSVGGGVCVNAQATLQIQNTTISGNSAQFGGGVISEGALQISNSTLIQNNGSASGGGLYAGAGSTIIESSIIAGNTSPAGPEVNRVAAATVTSSGFNLVGDSIGDAQNSGNAIAYQSTDILNTDPQLGALSTSDGKPTPTHLPQAFGPGHDKGRNFGSPALFQFDQRGNGRSLNWGTIENALGGDGTDIGAVELLIPTAAPVSLGGRLRTANGQGIRGAVVTVSGGNLAGRSVYTNTFGYYRIEGLSAGETYVVTVGAKRYVFSTPSMVVSLTDDLSDLDFVSD